MALATETDTGRPVTEVYMVPDEMNKERMKYAGRILAGSSTENEAMQIRVIGLFLVSKSFLLKGLRSGLYIP